MVNYRTKRQRPHVDYTATLQLSDIHYQWVCYTQSYKIKWQCPSTESKKRQRKIPKNVDLFIVIQLINFILPLHSACIHAPSLMKQPLFPPLHTSSLLYQNFFHIFYAALFSVSATLLKLYSERDHNDCLAAKYNSYAHPSPIYSLKPFPPLMLSFPVPSTSDFRL